MLDSTTRLRMAREEDLAHSRARTAVPAGAGKAGIGENILSVTLLIAASIAIVWATIAYFGAQ